MDETVRAFIAIELSPQAHGELASLQETLKKSGADVKWVEPENIHLTLKFLGDIDPVKTEELKKLLTEAAAASKDFEVTIKGIGAFPNLSSPKVIWAGLDLGAAESIRLADAVEAKLISAGIPKEERKFHPHLTLGRVRNGRDLDKLRKILEATRFEAFAKTRADHITLFRSRLTPKGSIYTPLFKASMAIS